MTPRRPLPHRWLIAGVTPPGASGGPIRAHHVFAALAERTGSRATPAYGRRGLPALALAMGSASGGWRRPLAVASTQLVPRPGLGLLRGAVRAAVLDLHDQPVLQAEALGMPLDPEWRAGLERVFHANVDRFERLVVPSASFIDLCGLPANRSLVVTNGTDTSHITPGAPPDGPVVALVSGAAPGRGIELLVDAMEAVRADVPDARLRLALSATGVSSAAYRDQLRVELGTRPWAVVAEISYGLIGAFLADAALAVIPHPPGAYFDASTPVKLFDAMAAGRPVVVTPRVETAAIVTAADAGLVAASDRAEDLAASILALLGDAPERRRMGENARRAAVERYDWRALANTLADAILGPDDAPA